MAHIKLATPTPRKQILEVAEAQIPVYSIQYLEKPSEDVLFQKSFGSVLSERRTQYEFATLPDRKLSSLLWYSFRTIDVFNDNFGQPCMLKPTPSAGGRHPIRLVVIEPNSAAKIYFSCKHAFGILDIEKELIADFTNEVNQVVPCGKGTIIWFAADFARTLSKYNDGESLVWRDSGALSQTLHLVSECLELNFCQLGIDGEPFIENMFSRVFDGVGGCIVGGRVPHA